MGKSPSSSPSGRQNAFLGLVPGLSCIATAIVLTFTSPETSSSPNPLPSTQANLSAALYEQSNFYLSDSTVFSLDQ